MRIVIEIDGAEKAAAATATHASEDAEATSPATDGGAAPDSGNAESAEQGSDGGGPSPQLLEAIRAAEASEKHSGSEADFPADATDGGGAPSADTHY